MWRAEKVLEREQKVAGGVVEEKKSEQRARSHRSYYTPRHIRTLPTERKKEEIIKIKERKTAKSLRIAMTLVNVTVFVT